MAPRAEVAVLFLVQEAATKLGTTAQPAPRAEVAVLFLVQEWPPKLGTTAQSAPRAEVETRKEGGGGGGTRQNLTTPNRWLGKNGIAEGMADPRCQTEAVPERAKIHLPYSLFEIFDRILAAQVPRGSILTSVASRPHTPRLKDYPRLGDPNTLKLYFPILVHQIASFTSQQAAWIVNVKSSTFSGTAFPE